MLPKWQRGFEIAKVASTYATAPKHSRKMGAALFSGANLISIGFNQYGHSHPAAPWNIHAEHRALIRRRHYNNNNDMTIYVYREMIDGKPATSRPCSNCMKLLLEAGVKKVRFMDEVGTPREMKIK